MPLSATDWVIAVVVAATLLVIMEITKAVLRSRSETFDEPMRAERAIPARARA